MKLINKIAAALLLAATFAAPAFASVTQSTAPAGYNGYMQWGWHELGTVTFAEGTNSVSALTSTAGIRDQGWGGEYPDGNQVFIGLFNNDTQLWGKHVAGAFHTYSVQSYSILDDQVAFTALNTALRGIDWSNGANVTMKMIANPIGWGGWELHVDNASFTVTSANVPEPGSVALLGLGLTGLLVARRKSKQN